MGINVLIVDDDLRMRQLIADILEEEGITPIMAEDGVSAIEILGKKRFDIVLTDMKMPLAGGMAVLEYLHDKNQDTLVIVITGYGTVESAIEAMKKGAYDYIQKPFEPDELLMIIKRAAEHVRLLNENKRLMREVEGMKYDEIIGISNAINDLKDTISRVAHFDATVLIQGETGTGKELVAKSLHRQSKRSSGIFLPVNCAALSETLLESELFGYERGAFTGADRQKKGLFEAADKGVIFLDEINAAGVSFQVKLLRVLQEGSFMRVGGTEQVKADVRVIAASNTPLEKDVKTGCFRNDLFYRLNVVTIEIPPLRKRREDIPILAYHFLNKYSARYGKEINGISSKALEKLTSYSWPGNVRELENVVERAVIMENSAELNALHFPDENSSALDMADCAGLVGIEEMQKALIARTLRSLQGQKAKAAEVLGISTTSLWRKIKKYNLE
jgi:DNA-binding NtrC family response regulator